MRGALQLAMFAAGLAAASPALAQETQAPAPESAASNSDVTVFPASYFNQFRSQHALEMIGRLPNFTYDEGERGSRLLSAAGNVLIDGERPALEGRGLTESLIDIPASQVVRIELIRNGANGIDMAGWPELVNVVVRNNGVITGNLRLEAGQNPEGRYSASGSAFFQRRVENRVVDFGLDIGRDPNGGGYSITEETEFFPDGTIEDFERIRRSSGGMNGRVNFRGGYDGDLLGGRLRFDASTGYGDSASRSIEEDLLTDVVTIGSTRQNSNRNRNISFRFDRDIIEDLEIQLRISHRDNRSQSRTFYTTGNRVFISRRKSGSQDATLSARFDRWDGIVLEGGIDFELIWQGGNQVFLRNGVPIGSVSESVDARRLRSQAFIEATWEMTPRIRLEGDVRFDTATVMVGGPSPSEQSFPEVRPGLELTYRIAPLTEASVSVDRGVDPVNINNFISSVNFGNDPEDDDITLGNTELVPETDWTYRARFQHRWGRRGFFQVQLTHTEYSDIVGRRLVLGDPILDSGGDPILHPETNEPLYDFDSEIANLGGGTRENVSVNLNLPLDRWGIIDGLVRLSGTWRSSSREDLVGGGDRPFSGEEPFSWSVGVSKEFADGAFRTGIDASGDDDSINYGNDDDSVTSRDAYYSAYAEYRVTPKLTVRFQARDLSTRQTIRDGVDYRYNNRGYGLIDSISNRVSESGPSYEFSIRQNF